MPSIRIGKAGYLLQFDEQDRDLALGHNWTADIHETNVYAARREIDKATGKKRKIYLHREIMGVTDRSVFVDHKDRDGLNNKRENLQQTTCAGNNQNRTYGMAAHAKRARGGNL